MNRCKYNDRNFQQSIGAFYTPDDIIERTLQIADEYLGKDAYKASILEPTAGDGNFVIGILNWKVAHGLSKEEALHTTFANELMKEEAAKCTERVRQWYGATTEWTCMNEDATKHDFSNLDYTYVIGNLPFGSRKLSQLPRLIYKNVARSKCVLITKASNPANIKNLVKEEVFNFPGVCWRCQIGCYDVAYTTGKKYLKNKYADIFQPCKLDVEVSDESYTHVVMLMTAHHDILRIKPKSYYDTYGRLPVHRMLLKLTDAQYDKLSNGTIPTVYKEYRAEQKMMMMRMDPPVLRNLIAYLLEQ